MFYYKIRGQFLSFDLRNGFYIYVSALYDKENECYRCTYYIADNDSDFSENLFMVGIGEDIIYSNKNELFKTLQFHIDDIYKTNEEIINKKINNYKYLLMCISKGDEYYIEKYREKEGNK